MKIFISYRREDAAGYNLMLAEQLSRHFGRQNIFMDIDSIKPGLDFRTVLQDAVGSCDALIALIGKSWMSAADSEGHRRLDAEEDWVRLEIAAALDRQDILVIPALVHGAHMPRAEDLPDRLRPLAYRNAIELSDARFQFDADRLARALKTTEETRKSTRPPIWRRVFAPLAGAARQLPRGRALVVPLAAGIVALAILAVLIKLLLGILFPAPSPGPLPAMAMAPPGQGPALARDPLTDGKGGFLPFPSNDPAHYRLGFVGGEYDLNVTDGKWLGGSKDLPKPVLKIPASADQSIAVDARLVGTVGNRNVSVRCRVTESPAYTGYILWVDPVTRTYTLGMDTASGTATTLKRASSNAIQPGIRWNRLQLSCIGDTITVVINGRRLASVRDTHFPSGTLGIGAGTTALVPSVEARFANLEVTRPATKVLLYDAAPGHTGALPLSSSASYRQKYVGGAYVVGVFDRKFLSQHAYSVPFTDLGTQVDTTMALDVDLTTGSTNAFVRLNCRRQVSADGNTVTDYGFSVTPGTQSWALTRQDTSGALKTLASNDSVPAIKSIGSNRVELSCAGNTLTGRVNGRTVVSKVDTTFPMGDVGLSVGDTSGPSVVAEFRNIVVSKP